MYIIKEDDKNQCIFGCVLCQKTHTTENNDVITHVEWI